jgi:adenosylmethionine-8-amino-7-oxononanoate aminotransferase
MTRINGVGSATSANNADHSVVASQRSAVLHRHLEHDFPKIAKGEGIYLHLEDGRKIIDASGGASVGCIGWGNQRVIRAVTNQMLEMPYCATIFYSTEVAEALCQELVDNSRGGMSRAYIVNSGQCPSCPTSSLTYD